MFSKGSGNYWMWTLHTVFHHIYNPHTFIMYTSLMNICVSVHADVFERYHGLQEDIMEGAGEFWVEGKPLSWWGWTLAVASASSYRFCLSFCSHHYSPVSEWRVDRHPYMHIRQRDTRSEIQPTSRVKSGHTVADSGETPSTQSLICVIH